MRTTPPAAVLATISALFVLAACDTVEDLDEPPAAGAAVAGAELPFRPNVLWLVAEDLGPIIPPFGDSTVATPTLSRLAAEGVRFVNVFSPSGVCAPSRAAIATGLYPTAIGAQHMRTGPWWGGRPGATVIQAAADAMGPELKPYEAVPPPEARMLSEHLRMAGYFATNNRKQDYQFVAPVTAWDESGADAHWLNREPGQPFFAVFNFDQTHESRIWTRSGAALRVPEGLDVEVPPYLPDTDSVRADLRRIYSNIIEMDEDVGRRLAELESHGLLDSTIVVWFTDHGGPLPRQKRALYDSGLRVPMIVRYPNRMRAGAVDSTLISFVDFLPTALAQAGIRPPEYLHGVAFDDADGTRESREFVFAAADRFDEATDTRRAVRDRQYKYIRNLNPDRSAYLEISYRLNIPTMREMLRMKDANTLTPVQAMWFSPTKPAEELYDTALDPYEINNLAADSAYGAVLARMRGALDDWQRAYPDHGLQPEAEYLRSLWPDGVQPTTASPVVDDAGEMISLGSATPGASIGYRFLAPGESGASAPRWLVYERPMPKRSGTLFAIAHRIGYLPSDTVEVRLGNEP